MSDELCRYYAELSLVTRGPLFSWARLVAIVRLNLGLDDALLGHLASEDAGEQPRRHQKFDKHGRGGGAQAPDAADDDDADDDDPDDDVTQPRDATTAAPDGAQPSSTGAVPGSVAPSGGPQRAMHTTE
jgi:hypothetical protein